MPERLCWPTTTDTAGDRLPVRFRSRDGLKPLDARFSPEFLFAPEEARHDHVQVRLRADIHLHDATHLDDVVERLGDRADTGTLFRVVQKRGHLWGVSVERNRWLIAGRGGTLRWIEQGCHLYLEITLDLNPQRFLAHQETADLAAIRALPPEHALRRRAEAQAFLTAQSLDGADNILIGPERLGGTSFDRREMHWRDLLGAYLHHVEALVRAQLSRWSVREVSVDLAAVSQAEVCWELRHPDAPSWIGDLRKTIFAIASDPLWRRAGKPLEAGRRVNADWIAIPLAKHVSVRIYAKQSDRVRFEVCYFGRIAEEVRRGGRHLSAESVIATLACLPARACGRLRQLWDVIMRYAAQQEPDAADVLDFLDRLYRAVPRERARAVMSLLANGRGITETANDGIAPSRLCAALEREGVVVRPGRARNRAAARYALDRRFSAMFDALLGRHDCPPSLPQ